MKTRNYKTEYKRSCELMESKPGAHAAERERVKLAQRKRRRDEGLRRREREYARKRRDDPLHLARSRKWTAEWRKRRISECQAIIHNWKQQGCCVCGESATCCIDAHHKNQSEKEHNIGQLGNGSKSPAVLLDELAKCIAICANCHRKYHAGEDQVVVEAVIAITGHPWTAVEGLGVPNGKKKMKEMNRLGPFGKPIYKEDQD